LYIFEMYLFLRELTQYPLPLPFFWEENSYHARKADDSILYFIMSLCNFLEPIAVV
jgi:hypothetical protein